MELLGFRVVLVLIFLLAAWKFGDWRNWPKYYPSILFVMVINMSASFLSYHHSLWNYSKDILVSTETMVEFFNAYANLPTTVLIYLSHFPQHEIKRQVAYVGFWVALYSGLEFIDHYIVGGIFYTNGWSWSRSVIFDIAMFSIIRLHYLNPGKAWLMAGAVWIFVVVQFGFLTGEMK